MSRRATFAGAVVAAAVAALAAGCSGPFMCNNNVALSAISWRSAGASATGHGSNTVQETVSPQGGGAPVTTATIPLK